MTEKRRLYMQTYNSNYTKSIKGMIKYIYSHQVRNCISREHTKPTYTSEELYTWFVENKKAMEIYTNWVSSEYDPELKPSIDRLNNSKTYSFLNIEAVTWVENKKRAYIGIRDKSISNSTLLNGGHKAVSQFSIDGKHLADFISLSEAERTTGVDHRGIADVCLNKKHIFHYYRWCYTENYLLFLKTLTEDYLKRTKTRYLAAQGYILTIEFFDAPTKSMTVAEGTKLLGISTHNTIKMAKGITTNRSPKKPENIKNITIKVKNGIN